MTNKEMVTMARSKSMECIFDADGDVCVRPMLFDNGIRQCRYAPDPCEFVRREVAEAVLAK